MIGDMKSTNPEREYSVFHDFYCDHNPCRCRRHGENWLRWRLRLLWISGRP